MAYIRNAGGQFAIIDLAGQRFGRLVALRACGRGKDGRVRWLCICDCGREFEVGGGLRNGHTKSCGCLRFITTVRLKVEENQLVDVFGEIATRIEGLKGA